MRCPMAFGDPCADRDESCREDCAWRIAQGSMVVCAVVALAAKESPYLTVENVERKESHGTLRRTGIQRARASSTGDGSQREKVNASE